MLNINRLATMDKGSLKYFTYFDKNFIELGITAVESFKKHNPKATGFIYCFELETEKILKEYFKNENVFIINIKSNKDIEKKYLSYLEDRTHLEALISLKPSLIRNLMCEIGNDDLLAYIDADLFFYSNLSFRLRHLDDFEILLSKHIFPFSMRESIKYGKFNAGLIVLRNSKNAMRFIVEWEKLCSEWCKLEFVDGKYADQKYLDELSDLPGVVQLTDPGMNNGMYYFSDYQSIKRMINNEFQVSFVNDYRLICFHFHGLRIYKKYIFTGFNRYKFPKNFFQIFRYIYLPILVELESVARKLELMKYSKLQPSSIGLFSKLKWISRFTIVNRKIIGSKFTKKLINHE